MKAEELADVFPSRVWITGEEFVDQRTLVGERQRQSGEKFDLSLFVDRRPKLNSEVLQEQVAVARFYAFQIATAKPFGFP